VHKFEFRHAVTGWYSPPTVSQATVPDGMLELLEELMVQGKEEREARRT